jgi:hypothetical protein
MHTAHGYATHSSSTPLVPHTFSRRDLCSNDVRSDILFCVICLAGSLVGGIAETRGLLDFCAKSNVLADIELTPIQKIQSAFDRVTAGDINYIDISSLQQQPA